MNLSKKNKILIVILLASMGTGFYAYKYVMQPPTAIEFREADFTGTAKEFVNAVRKKPIRFRDKVIILKGKVTFRTEEGLTLNSQVFCQFKEKQPLLKLGQTLEIKGRFIGYDDLMDDVKLDQCIVK